MKNEMYKENVKISSEKKNVMLVSNSMNVTMITDNLNYMDRINISNNGEFMYPKL